MIKMMKPLVLKPKGNSSSQTNNARLLTVNDLISRFSIKSSTSQICLTDRSSKSTKSISSSNNKQFFKRKSQKNFQLSQKQQINRFRKIKILTTNHANNKQILQFQKLNFKANQQKDRKTKSERQLQLNLQFLKNRQNKSLVSEIVRHIKSTIKQQIQNKLDIGKNRAKITKMKLKRPLTDRSQQKLEKYPQIISHSNIRPEIFQNNNKQASKYHQGEVNLYQLDIKKSNCSTLSLKTKHTLSLQNFQECQELFTKQEYKNEKKSEKSQLNNPTLNQLQKVKEKIYNQIYSLDKKLLIQNLHKKTNKPITISLRKKQKLVQQKQGNVNLNESE